MRKGARRGSRPSGLPGAPVTGDLPGRLTVPRLPANERRLVRLAAGPGTASHDWSAPRPHAPALVPCLRFPLLGGHLYYTELLLTISEADTLS